VANRLVAELEPLVGFFVNSLVVRTDLSGGPSGRDVLGRVRQATLEAFAHQEVPFERLVDALQPQRDLSRSPLFQVMFVLQNAPIAAASAAGLSVADVDLGIVQSANFDLTLHVNPQADGLDLLLVFDTALFDRATAERLLGAYETLLAALVANPAAPVARLPLIGQAERRRVLYDWNATVRNWPSDRPVHELFAAQVARTPDAPAACCEGRELSYADLDRRANRLARHLQRFGAGPETPVGVLLERSLDLPVALLAVLRSGAAYLPLDPAHPPARWEQLLRDAGARLLVTTTGLAAQLPARTVGSNVPDGPEPGRICLDGDAAVLESLPPDAPPPSTGPESLAYVLYTSGSTGAPKGVEVLHRGLTNHALALAERYGLAPGDRVLQFLSVAFDASLEELLPPLVSGAAVVLHPAPASLEPRELLEYCLREQVNVLHIPPPVWLPVGEALAAGDASGLRLKTVLTGGEAITAEQWQTWRSATAGRTKLLVAYGVTEATITTTIDEPAAESELEPQSRVPIGRPIPNCRAYVLDEGLEPLPVGVAGELCLGGVGVARGYRGQPELTRERFVPDPFGLSAGAQLYRTGDRARWRPDGRLEFLGRQDDQVKIRGHRVELGEIESALALFPAVREAVVVVHETHGRKRLAAYVAPVNGHAPTPHELREHLQERLPAAVVPSSFTVLPSLPRNSAGKVDRRALPAPDAESIAADRAYEAPRDEREELLARVWADVLGLPRVGIHDNFFGLGGDSILTLQVVSRARAAGLQITPKQLFLHQTVAELAAQATAASAVRAEQGPVTGAAPLSPIQRAFFGLELAEPWHFNQSLLLDVRPGLAPHVVQDALACIVRHHDALRLRFRQAGGDWVQDFAPPETAPPALEWIDLAPLNESDRAVALDRETARIQSGMDLAVGSLVRAAWFDLGAGLPARLLLTVHHLVIDAVSWRVLLEDLNAACEQISRGEQVRLPAKTSSWRNWTERFAAQAQDPQVIAELTWWTEALANVEARLPVDRPAGGSLVSAAATVTRSLDERLTDALLHSAHEAYRTRPQELLLAALADALARWTGRPATLVDVEGHGRGGESASFDDLDVSRTVGWFTAIHPVALIAASDAAPGERIAAVKEFLRAVPHEGLHYGVLRHLAVGAAAEALSALPPAEVSFNYLGQLDRTVPADAPLIPVETLPSHQSSPRNRRPHMLEILARVQHSRLTLDVVYDTLAHDGVTIERLADDYLAELSRLIEHCLDPRAGGFTASDFPLAALDADEAAALARLLGSGPTGGDAP
jgi:amino acid adenylation domain-containing protein/non-ribosomal peptide synthase protein (TIGR01720 family)